MSDRGRERLRRPTRSLLGGRARHTSAPTGPTSLCRPALNMSWQDGPIIHYLLISVVVSGCNQGVPCATLSTMYIEHPVVIASASMVFLVHAAPTCLAVPPGGRAAPRRGRCPPPPGLQRTRRAPACPPGPRPVPGPPADPTCTAQTRSRSPSPASGPPPPWHTLCLRPPASSRRYAHGHSHLILSFLKGVGGEPGPSCLS
jgi:hypothetical protein